jgi:pyruvate dehydrogenase E2 component (dihydrolipoamide acetyltransferase)
MTPAVVMPRLSDSMEEGTILSWRKQVGDAVRVGDDLVEIETDKANMSYESEFEGTLLAVLAAEGDICSVGAPIARIGAEGEQELAAAAPGRRNGDVGRAVGSEAGRQKPKASPVARRIARASGVDLTAVVPSGPGRRITRADVERAAAASTEPDAASTRPAPETAKGSVEIVEPSRLQGVVATRMSESKATAPHFYLRSDVDMSAAREARAGLRLLLGDAPAPSFNDLVIKACATALRDFPMVNGSYRDGHFELYSRINVGFAVAAERALVVPVVHDADRKGLAEIAAATRSLAGKVRDGAVTPPELAGGTFSVSNLGMFGVASFEAVLNPPQAAILAVGAIEQRPVVKDGEVSAAPSMSITLSGDHRILNGVDGARFLARVRALLEAPIGLSL